MIEYDALKKKLKAKLLSQMDYSREMTDEEMEEQIDTLFVEEPQIYCLSLPLRQKLRREIFIPFASWIFCRSW